MVGLNFLGFSKFVISQALGLLRAYFLECAGIVAGKVFWIVSKWTLSTACDCWSEDKVGSGSPDNPSEFMPSMEFCESSGREA